MNIDEIKAQLAAITPGEWTWDECNGNLIVGQEHKNETIILSTTYDDSSISYGNGADAEFIAAAPRIVRELLAEVEFQQRLLMEVQRVIAETERLHESSSTVMAIASILDPENVENMSMSDESGASDGRELY